jgi:hypothetical protein
MTPFELVNRRGCHSLRSRNSRGIDEPLPFSLMGICLRVVTGQFVWERAPGIVDTITRANDKLYVRTTGDAKAVELIPIGADTFFLQGSKADRLTFIRDHKGKVTAEDVRGPDGQGYRATRTD